jgi:hypothetical protein
MKKLDDISIFLDTVHGTKNDLLKAVSLDIKEKLFLAGAKALGPQEDDP